MNLTELATWHREEAVRTLKAGIGDDDSCRAFAEHIEAAATYAALAQVSRAVQRSHGTIDSFSKELQRAIPCKTSDSGKST